MDVTTRPAVDHGGSLGAVASTGRIDGDLVMTVEIRIGVAINVRGGFGREDMAPAAHCQRKHGPDSGDKHGRRDGVRAGFGREDWWRPRNPAGRMSWPRNDSNR